MITDTNIYKLIFIGLLTGALASFVGGGTEILIVPLLIFLNVVSNYKEAVGTSLASLLLPIGAVAVYFYYKQNCNGKSCVNWKYALILSFCFMLGTLVSYYSSKINTRSLKLIYGISIILLGILIIISDIYNY
jgi:hypothetical protein